MRAVTALFFCIFLCPAVFSSSLQCRDENNKPVDWFVAIKLPRLRKSENVNVKNGVAYMFITSNSIKNNWELSSLNVSDANSIMGNTLRPLYEGQVSKYARILYNDEPPHGQTSMTLGHTKGVAMGDNSSGFWLVHSVPHYPPEASSNVYSYPSTGMIYGQSFLCISLLPKDLNIIGYQLMYNEPYIYDAEVPETLSGSMPNFTAAAKGEHIPAAPWFNAEQFSSADGVFFTSFAKSKNFDKDLYADWVAQALKTDLFVETWNHGPGAKMTSECGNRYKVENVESMSLENFSFKTGEDHSKWAVSSEEHKAWICIGDINRMEHQKQRGGGTVCFQNTQLFHAYHDSIASLDVCPTSVVSL